MQTTTLIHWPGLKAKKISEPLFQKPLLLSLPKFLKLKFTNFITVLQKRQLYYT